MFSSLDRLAFLTARRLLSPSDAAVSTFHSVHEGHGEEERNDATDDHPSQAPEDSGIGRALRAILVGGGFPSRPPGHATHAVHVPLRRRRTFLHVPGALSRATGFWRARSSPLCCSTFLSSHTSAAPPLGRSV